MLGGRPARVNGDGRRAKSIAPRTGPRTMRCMGSKSFAARRVHNVILYVHTAAPATDDDWDGVLGYYENARDVKELRTLVYTDGAAPNASQRARLNAVLG